jgi:hypothetical protein
MMTFGHNRLCLWSGNRHTVTIHLPMHLVPSSGTPGAPDLTRPCPLPAGRCWPWSSPLVLRCIGSSGTDLTTFSLPVHDVPLRARCHSRELRVAVSQVSQRTSSSLTELSELQCLACAQRGQSAARYGFGYATVQVLPDSMHWLLN